MSFCAAKPSSVGGGSFSGSSDGNACAKRSMTAPGGRAIEHKFDDAGDGVHRKVRRSVEEMMMLEEVEPDEAYSDSVIQ